MHRIRGWKNPYTSRNDQILPRSKVSFFVLGITQYRVTAEDLSEKTITELILLCCMLSLLHQVFRRHHFPACDPAEIGARPQAHTTVVTFT